MSAISPHPSGHNAVDVAVETRTCVSLSDSRPHRRAKAAPADRQSLTEVRGVPGVRVTIAPSAPVGFPVPVSLARDPLRHTLLTDGLHERIRSDMAWKDASDGRVGSASGNADGKVGGGKRGSSAKGKKQ